MSRFATVLFGLFLFGCTASPPMEQRHADNIYNVMDLQQSVVTIVKYNDDGRLSGPQCTAFYISPRELATALHCVEDSNVQTIQIAPGLVIQISDDSVPKPTIGREILFVDWDTQIHTIENFDPDVDPIPRRSRVIAIDSENDVAILELAYNEDNSEHWIPMSDSYRVGERTYSMGFPRNQLWLLSEGMLSSVRQYPNGRMRLLFQGIVAPGSSGSPLINNRGQLIGVVIQYARSIPGLGIASPSTAVRDLQQQGEQMVFEFTQEEILGNGANKPAACDPESSSCPMPNLEE